MSYVNSHETFSNDLALEHVLSLKITAKETNHQKAPYYATVFQSLREKLQVPNDQFKRYILVLLGDKDQEKVYERLSKVDKAFDRRNDRAGQQTYRQ